MSELPSAGDGATAAAAAAAAAVGPLRALTAWSAIASLAQALSRLGSVVILAQLLSPREAGAVVYDLWLAGTALMLCGAGLGGALQRFLAELDGLGERAQLAGLASWAARRFALQLLAGALALAALLPFLGTELGSGRLWTLPLVLALQGLEALGGALLSGQRRFGEIALRTLAAGALTLAAVAAGAYAGGVDGALCGFALGALPLALRGASALVVGAPAAAAPPEPGLARRFWRYALTVWITAIASAVIWTRMELVFIERFHGVAMVAAYGMALTWAGMVGQLPALGLGALLPHFAARSGGGDAQGLRRTYTQASRLMAAVSIPLSCGALLYAPCLLPLVFGSAYAAAVPSAIILCAAAAAGFASVGNALFYGLDRSQIILRTSLAGAVLALVLDLVVIPRWGILGAAWLRAALQAASIAFTLWYLGRHLGARTPYAALLRIAGATALAGVPWWLGSRAGAGWPASAAGALSGLVLLLAGMRLLRVLAPEDHRAGGRAGARAAGWRPARARHPARRRGAMSGSAPGRRPGRRRVPPRGRPRPGAAAERSMNQDAMWAHYQGRERGVFAHSAVRLARLVRLVPAHARVLNIGIGDGAFEELALARGLEVHALDPDAAAVAALRTRLALGERAQAGRAEAIPFPDRHFDAVVMSEVLEHLDDAALTGARDEAHRVLRPGGRLIVTVPAGEDLAEQLRWCARSAATATTAGGTSSPSTARACAPSSRRASPSSRCTAACSWPGRRSTGRAGWSPRSSSCCGCSGSTAAARSWSRWRAGRHELRPRQPRDVRPLCACGAPAEGLSACAASPASSASMARRPTRRCWRRCSTPSPTADPTARALRSPGRARSATAAWPSSTPRAAASRCSTRTAAWGWCAMARSTTTAPCAPSSRAMATASAAPATARSRSTPMSSGARRASSACAGCSPWR